MIEHDVWVGQNVRMARGIKIGTGAVIAAGAIATEDVPPYAVVGGTPARVIKYRFPEELRAVLLASAWWRCSPALLKVAPFRDVERLVGFLQEHPLEPWVFAKSVTAAEMVANVYLQRLPLATLRQRKSLLFCEQKRSAYFCFGTRKW